MMIKLSDASRRLKAPYQRLFNGVASGTIPAQRDANGTRWMIDDAHLGAIAAILGIAQAEQKITPPAPAKSKRARAAA
jgi:hypothetical protein